MESRLRAASLPRRFPASHAQTRQISNQQYGKLEPLLNHTKQIAEAISKLQDFAVFLFLAL
jgi:hypothetical protein